MFATLFSFLTQLPFDLLSPFFIYAESTDLVPWGSNLSTNVGYPRYPKLVSSMVVLSPHVLSVAVGLILGDAWVSFSSKHHKNAHLSFKQSVSHFEYFWHIFTTFSPPRGPPAAEGARRALLFKSPIPNVWFTGREKVLWC
jgi:LAGLIDADG DNA endonuclease family